VILFRLVATSRKTQLNRHCEERSDAATQGVDSEFNAKPQGDFLGCFAALAMTTVLQRSQWGMFAERVIVGK
jgi:hypothetical protein